jgi:uncharacterized protein YprB with RNaseH-like and TPR domain
MKTPRIVTLDIETSPIESYHWGLWDQNINLDQIQTEWTILSFSAKWLDENNVIYKDTGGKGISKVRDDKFLLQKLWEILDEADIVIAQNGQAFDLKKINARMLMHGLGPYSPIKVIDTLLVAKRTFGFTSNKLAWMSEHLTKTKKDKHKLFPGFELWEECLKDNPKAWKEMKKYNNIDVVATEQLYIKMRPWIENHPNLAVYAESHSEMCPKCGSCAIQKRGKYYTQLGVYHRIFCKYCGGWSRSRQTLNAGQRKSLLNN